MTDGKARRVRWGRYLGAARGRAKESWTARADVRFAARFLALFALAQLLLVLFLEQRAMRRATAAAVVATAPLFGLDAARAGDAVSFDGAFTYVVARECTGLSVVGLAGAAVLAYPARPAERLRGLLLCTLAVLVANLVRLDVLGWIGVHRRAWFDVAHHVAWEAGLVLVAALAFLLWTRRVRAQDAPEPHATRAARPALRPAFLFALVFVGLLAPGLALDLDDMLGAALVALATPAGRALWGAAYPPPELARLIAPTLLLTSLCGYTALLLAMRVRFRAVLLGAILPGLLAALAGTLVMAAAHLGAFRTIPLPLVLIQTTYLAFPALSCFLTAHTLRERGAPPAAARPSTPRPRASSRKPPQPRA